MGSWSQKLHHFLGLFLESPCPLCQRSTPLELCQDCQRQVQRCRLNQPAVAWQGVLPLFAWGSYGGALKRAIAALKYDQQLQLARPLGQWLAQSWIEAKLPLPTGSDQPVVVPIPMHKDKLKQRGFNQAELLAQSFCAVTGLKLCSQGLQRVRLTEAQFGLSAVAREQNLANAFKLGKGLDQNRAILLLDDIYTTGATARSAIQTLTSANITVQGLVTLAQAR